MWCPTLETRDDATARRCASGILRSSTTLSEFLPYQPWTVAQGSTVAMTGNAE